MIWKILFILAHLYVGFLVIKLAINSANYLINNKNSKDAS